MSQRYCLNGYGKFFIINGVMINFVFNNLCETVSQFMVVSRQMTTTRGRDLLAGLETVRQGWLEQEGVEEITLRTIDGTAINGLHFKGSEKKAIIHLHGNGCFYETSLERPWSWRESLQRVPHLVVCNPGGTGKSEGNVHPETAAHELLAQFEYLVNVHSIDPDDIVISGHSMGGYLGAFGAQLIQEKYPDKQINFLSDRSFFHIYSRIDIRTEREDRPTWINRIIRLVMYFFVNVTRWAKDPIEALTSLKGRICVIYHQKDAVVAYEDSLYCALTKVEQSKRFEYLPLTGEDENAHNREFTEEEHKKVISEIKRMLHLV
jgi:hypothetical protein